MELPKKNFFETYTQKQIKEFKVNYFYLFLIANFLSYGIFAVYSKNTILFVELLIYLNFFLFFFLWNKSENLFHLNIKINFLDVCTLIFFSCFFLILLFSEIKSSIVEDELATTLRASRTSIYTSLVLTEILNYDFLNKISNKYIVHFLNFFQTLLILFTILILRKQKKIGLILLIFLTLIFRFSLKDPSIHPPLNHLISIIFFSIFGLSEFVIRYSYLFGFILFLISTLKLLVKHKYNYFVIFSFLISISTIPIVSLTSVIPDHSIWSLIIISYILFYIYLEKETDYFFIISLISIGVLFRVSIISVFGLLVTLMILEIIKKRNLKLIFDDFLLKKKAYLVPLIFLPFFIYNIIFGTPSFEGLSQNSSFFNFVKALKSGVIINTIIKQIPYFYLPFIFFFIFVKNRIEITVFFLLNLFLFFSIKEELWGNPKYVIEFAIPFVFLGHLIFNDFLVKKRKYLLIIFTNILLTTTNLFDYIKFPNKNFEFNNLHNTYTKFNNNRDKDSRYILKIPYNYGEAYKFIKKNSYQDETIVIATKYGIIQEIIQGYTSEQINNIISLQDKINKLDIEINKNFYKKTDLLKNIDKLNYILLGDIENKYIIRDILLNDGWINIKNFYNLKYNTELILLKRKS